MALSRRTLIARLAAHRTVTLLPGALLAAGYPRAGDPSDCAFAAAEIRHRGRISGDLIAKPHGTGRRRGPRRAGRSGARIVAHSAPT